MDCVKFRAIVTTTHITHRIFHHEMSLASFHFIIIKFISQYQQKNVRGK